LATLSKTSPSKNQAYAFHAGNLVFGEGLILVQFGPTRLAKLPREENQVGALVVFLTKFANGPKVLHGTCLPQATREHREFMFS